MADTYPPEGWSEEPADPSVGIFFSAVWHEDCPAVAINDELHGAEQKVVRVDQKPWPGGGCEITETVRFTCPDCDDWFEATNSFYEPPEDEECWA